MITSEDVQELIAAMQSLGSTIEETGTSGAIDSSTESMREGFAKDIAKYIDIQADKNAKSLSNPATGGGVFDQMLEGTRNIVNELQSINKNLELNKRMSGAATMIGSAGAGSGVGKALSGVAGMAGGLLKLAPLLLNPAGIAAMGGVFGLSRNKFDISKWMGNITSPFKGTKDNPMSFLSLLGFENDPVLEAEDGTPGGRFRKGLIERVIESLFGYLGIDQGRVATIFDWLMNAWSRVVDWFDTVIVDQLKKWYEDSPLKKSVDGMLGFLEEIKNILGFDNENEMRDQSNNMNPREASSTPESMPTTQPISDPFVPPVLETQLNPREQRREDDINALLNPSKQENNLPDMTDDNRRSFMRLFNRMPTDPEPGTRRDLTTNNPFSRYADGTPVKPTDSIEDGIITADGKIIRIDNQDSLLALKPGGPLDKMLNSMDNTDVIQAINDLQDITTQLLTQQIEGQVALAQIVAANTGGDNIINAPTSVVNMDNSTNDNIVLGTMKSRIYG